MGPAALQRQRQGQKAAVSTNVSYAQSQEMLQGFLSAGFGCITFLRGLFPENNYVEERVGALPLQDESKKNRNGVRVKKLRRGYSYESDLLLDWIEQGIFDALEKKYLRSVVFGIYLEESKPFDLVESYTFNFAYHEQGVEVRDENGGLIGVPTGDAAKGIQMGLYQVRNISGYLQDVRYLRMKLFYTNKAPLDYEPPLFRQALLEEKLQFTLNDRDELVAQEAGAITTGYHAISLKIMSVQDKILHDMDEEAAAADSKRSSVKRVEVDKDPPPPPLRIAPETANVPAAAKEHAASTNEKRAGSTTSRVESSSRRELRSMLKAPTRTESIVDTQPINQNTFSQQNGSDSLGQVKKATTRISLDPHPKESGEESVICECGAAVEEGDMIQCDKCQQWQHCVCYGFTSKSDRRIPKLHACYTCRFATMPRQLEDLQDLAFMRRALHIVMKRGFPSSNKEFARRLKCDLPTAIQTTRRLQDEGFVSLPKREGGKRYSANAIRTPANEKKIRQEYFDPLMNINRVSQPTEAADSDKKGNTLPYITSQYSHVTDTPQGTQASQFGAQPCNGAMDDDDDTTDDEYDLNHAAKTALTNKRPRAAEQDIVELDHSRKKVSVTIDQIQCPNSDE